MRNSCLSCLLLLSLFASSFSDYSRTKVSFSDTGIISFSPERTVIFFPSEDYFLSRVMADQGVDSLHGFDILITYSPDILRADSVSLGSLFDPYGCFCPTFTFGEGEIHLVCAILGPYVVYGPGEFLRLYFSPVSSGVCTLLIDSILLLTPTNEVIPTVTFPGIVRVLLNRKRIRVSAEGTSGRSPFRLSVSIQEPSELSLNIYDRTGRHIKTLSRGTRAPGRYVFEWFGTDESGKRITQGTYFYLLKLGEARYQGKMYVPKW